MVFVNITRFVESTSSLLQSVCFRHNTVALIQIILARGLVEKGRCLAC